MLTSFQDYKNIISTFGTFQKKQKWPPKPIREHFRTHEKHAGPHRVAHNFQKVWFLLHLGHYVFNLWNCSTSFGPPNESQFVFEGLEKPPVNLVFLQSDLKAIKKIWNFIIRHIVSIVNVIWESELTIQKSIDSRFDACNLNLNHPSSLRFFTIVQKLSVR